MSYKIYLQQLEQHSTTVTMENLRKANIECTAPDQLQFCHKISGTEFWYCEPNTYHEDLWPESNTIASRLYQKYCGYPCELLADALIDEEVLSFISNTQLWLTGTISIDEFSWNEQEHLLKDYGYSWNDFTIDVERNQIICENHFEQYSYDYRNDI